MDSNWPPCVELEDTLPVMLLLCNTQTVIQCQTWNTMVLEFWNILELWIKPQTLPKLLIISLEVVQGWFILLQTHPILHVLIISLEVVQGWFILLQTHPILHVLIISLEVVQGWFIPTNTSHTTCTNYLPWSSSGLVHPPSNTSHTTCSNYLPWSSSGLVHPPSQPRPILHVLIISLEVVQGWFIPTNTSSTIYFNCVVSSVFFAFVLTIFNEGLI